MNLRSYNEYDYLNCLVATPKRYSGWEAGRVPPFQAGHATAPDAINRMRNRKEPNSDDLGEEAKTLVNLDGGWLELDDSTLDQPYANKLEWVYRHGSGKHHQTVRGINLLTLMWSEGDQPIPGDYRIDNKVQDQLSKNHHFCNQIQRAPQRGFKPA